MTIAKGVVLDSLTCRWITGEGTVSVGSSANISDGNIEILENNAASFPIGNDHVCEARSRKGKFTFIINESQLILTAGSTSYVFFKVN